MKCGYVQSRLWPWSVSMFAVIALGGALASCNSDSSTPPTTTTTKATITIPLGDTLRNVPVLANQTTQVIFTHAIPPTTVTSWKPNLSATMSQVHVTVPTPVRFLDALALVRAAVTESVSLSVRVAPASQRSTVCTTGIPTGRSRSA